MFYLEMSFYIGKLISKDMTTMLKNIEYFINHFATDSAFIIQHMFDPVVFLPLLGSVLIFLSKDLI